MKSALLKRKSNCMVVNSSGDSRQRCLFLKATVAMREVCMLVLLARFIRSKEEKVIFMAREFDLYVW